MRYAAKFLAESIEHAKAHIAWMEESVENIKANLMDQAAQLDDARTRLAEMNNELKLLNLKETT